MLHLHRLQTYSDWGLLALRLAVGSIFLIHGIGKWSFWGMMPGDQMSAGMLNLMKFLSIVEPLGGLALILGFLTHYAALGLAIIMVGAIYFKMFVFKLGFVEQAATGWEFDLALLGGNLALFFLGAGRMAIDKLRHR